MNKLLLRKWWVLLLQGVLMLFISFFLFRNPASVLTTMSIWLGLLILISGLIGLVTSFGRDAQDHRLWAILWSITAIVIGFLLLTNIVATMKAITILVGVWMLVGGLRLITAGWIIRRKDALGWVVILSGIVAIVASIMIMTNLGTGVIGITVLLGTQVLIAALAIIVLALIKKKVGHALKDTIAEMKKS